MRCAMGLSPSSGSSLGCWPAHSVLSLREEPWAVPVPGQATTLFSVTPGGWQLSERGKIQARPLVVLSKLGTLDVCSNSFAP